MENTNSQKIQIYDEYTKTFVDLIRTTDDLTEDSSSILPTTKALTKLNQDVEGLKNILKTITDCSFYFYASAEIRLDLEEQELLNGDAQEINCYYKVFDETLSVYVVKHFVYEDFKAQKDAGQLYYPETFCVFSDSRVVLQGTAYYLELRAKRTDSWFKTWVSENGAIANTVTSGYEGNIINVSISWKISLGEYSAFYTPTINTVCLYVDGVLNNNLEQGDLRFIETDMAQYIIDNPDFEYSSHSINTTFYPSEIVLYEGVFYTPKVVTALPITSENIGTYWSVYVPSNNISVFYTLGQTKDSEDENITVIASVNDDYGMVYSKYKTIGLKSRFYNVINETHLSDVLENSKKEFIVSWQMKNTTEKPTLKVDFYYSGFEGDDSGIGGVDNTNLLASKILLSDDYDLSDPTTTLEASDVGTYVEKLYAGNVEGSKLNSVWMKVSDGLSYKLSQVSLFTILENFIIFQNTTDTDAVTQNFLDVSQSSINPCKLVNGSFSGLEYDEYFPVKISFFINSALDTTDNAFITSYALDEFVLDYKNLEGEVTATESFNTKDNPNPRFVFPSSWELADYEEVRLTKPTEFPVLTQTDFDIFKSFHTYYEGTYSFIYKYYKQFLDIYEDTEISTQLFLKTASKETAEGAQGDSTQTTTIQEYLKPSVIKTFIVQDKKTLITFQETEDELEYIGNFDEYNKQDLSVDISNTEDYITVLKSLGKTGTFCEELTYNASTIQEKVYNAIIEKLSAFSSTFESDEDALLFKAMVAGVTHSTTLPLFSSEINTTVTDNTITWKNIGRQGIYTGTPAVYAAETAYSVYDTAIVNDGTNDHIFYCKTPGTSAVGAPTWVFSTGTLTDGTVVWEYVSLKSEYDTVGTPGAWYTSTDFVLGDVVTISDRSLQMGVQFLPSFAETVVVNKKEDMESTVAASQFSLVSGTGESSYEYRGDYIPLTIDIVINEVTTTLTYAIAFVNDYSVFGGNQLNYFEIHTTTGAYELRYYNGTRLNTYLKEKYGFVFDLSYSLTESFLNCIDWYYNSIVFDYTFDLDTYDRDTKILTYLSDPIYGKYRYELAKEIYDNNPLFNVTYYKSLQFLEGVNSLVSDCSNYWDVAKFEDDSVEVISPHTDVSFLKIFKDATNYHNIYFLDNVGVDFSNRDDTMYTNIHNLLIGSGTNDDVALLEKVSTRLMLLRSLNNVLTSMYVNDDSFIAYDITLDESAYSLTFITTDDLTITQDVLALDVFTIDKTEVTGTFTYVITVKDNYSTLDAEYVYAKTYITCVPYNNLMCVGSDTHLYIVTDLEDYTDPGQVLTDTVTYNTNYVKYFAALPELNLILKDYLAVSDLSYDYIRSLGKVLTDTTKYLYACLIDNDSAEFSDVLTYTNQKYKAIMLSADDVYFTQLRQSGNIFPNFVLNDGNHYSFMEEVYWRDYQCYVNPLAYSFFNPDTRELRSGSSYGYIYPLDENQELNKDVDYLTTMNFGACFTMYNASKNMSWCMMQVYTKILDPSDNAAIYYGPLFIKDYNQYEPTLDWDDPDSIASDLVNIRSNEYMFIPFPDKNLHEIDYDYLKATETAGTYPYSYGYRADTGTTNFPSSGTFMWDEKNDYMVIPCTITGVDHFFHTPGTDPTAWELPVGYRVEGFETTDIRVANQPIHHPTNVRSNTTNQYTHGTFTRGYWRMEPAEMVTGKVLGISLGVLYLLAYSDSSEIEIFTVSTDIGDPKTNENVQQFCEIERNGILYLNIITQYRILVYKVLDSDYTLEYVTEISYEGTGITPETTTGITRTYFADELILDGVNYIFFSVFNQLIWVQVNSDDPLDWVYCDFYVTTGVFSKGTYECIRTARTFYSEETQENYVIIHYGYHYIDLLSIVSVFTNRGLSFSFKKLILQSDNDNNNSIKYYADNSALNATISSKSNTLVVSEDTNLFQCGIDSFNMYKLLK